MTSIRQFSIEADRIYRNDGKINLPGTELIPRDEKIRSQPEDDYKPPLFLSKTTSPEQVAALGDLLHQLRQINEEHVGENTLEVQVYYSVTGLGHPLEEAFRNWCESYFTERSTPRHLNPQVANDPFLLFANRQQELEDILGKLSRREHTLNFVFLNLSFEFVPWLLYRRLWGNLLKVEESEDGKMAYLAEGYRPDQPENTLAAMLNLSVSRGWLDNDAEQFLRRVCDAADSARLTDIARMPDAELRERLAGMAADIQEMRPLLVRGFKPRKTVSPLGRGLAAAWAWCVRYGIANLLIGEDEAEVAAMTEGNKTHLGVAVGHDGLLFDTRTPWVKADGLATDDRFRPLALNYHVLETFHSVLLSFYDRIDLRRVRSEVLAAGEDQSADEEVIVAALAASCGELGNAEAHAERTGCRRIRPLRSTRLLSLLEERFDCEVRQGKGSEVTVYRQGGRKFRLGHHGRCVEIHPVLLRRLLVRLGIGTGEWLRG